MDLVVEDVPKSPGLEEFVRLVEVELRVKPSPSVTTCRSVFLTTVARQLPVR